MKKSIGAKSLAYPNPVWCVGSYDSKGKANVMTVAWGGICCSNPPSVTISLRKATHSYASIIERGAYTISIPSEKYMAEADYFGIVSGRDHDKFKDTALTPIRSELVDAPYVDEFPLILECRLTQTVEIGLHSQFIAEIIDIKVDEDAINDQGIPIIEKIAPFIYGHGDKEYWNLGRKIGQSFSAGKKFKR